MKCSICEAENVPDARICKSCGSSIAHDPSNEETSVIDSAAIEHYVVNNRFKVIKKLGKGGMGEVLLAEDVKLKRQVAIKSILLANLSDTSSKVRFLREAQTASQLDHPNICTIYEIYEEDDRDYIVMQYIDGVTIDQVIGAKRLSIRKTLDISIQICAGMHEAHAGEIIHRDIKPGNIMIDRKGVVKILDFGLAKFTENAPASQHGKVDSNLTQKGFVMGTVAYISPEQAKGKTIDLRSDIFSFGALLYEMIESTNPFKREEQIETLYNVLNKNPEFERDISPELERIVLKALAKDRDDRYPNFAALKHDLETFQAEYLAQPDTGNENAGGRTEIIDMKEQEEILKEIQKTSDEEPLGDMISRIKKFNASTQNLFTTRKRKAKIWLIPILVIAVLVAAWLLMLNKGVFQGGDGGESPDPGETGTFYIYLHPFENKTGEKELDRMIQPLLVESLDQLDEFKTIDKATALSLTNGQSETGKPGIVDLALLKQKFDVKYELTGTITRDKNFYGINARLTTYPPTTEETPFPPVTTTGEGKNSLLNSQVELLTHRVYRYIFKEKERPRLKRISTIFGKNWQQYRDIFAGLGEFKRVELKKATDYFLKASESLISKYYLADIYYTIGPREESIKFIEQIMPEIQELTPSLQMKVRAIKARLKFKFDDELRQLKELKDRFQFSKDVFYKLGEAYFHHASPSEAITHYKEAVKLDPGHSSSLNHLGYCYSYLGEHDEAITTFEKVRLLDQSPNSFDSLGDGYFYSGDLLNAESMKQRAVLPDKDGKQIEWPFQTLADIYILTARYNDAQKALDHYLRLDSTIENQSYVLQRQALMRYQDKRYEEALQLIEQALTTFSSGDINDSTPEVNWLKARILLALGKVEESKTLLQWLEEFVGNYNLSRDNFKAAFKYYIHLKALIAEKENRIEDAEQHFIQLMDMKDKLSYWITLFHYQFFHTEYAKFLNRAGRQDEALAEIGKCILFNYSEFPYVNALWLKAQILETSGNTEEAQKVYQNLEELYGDTNEENHLRNLLKSKLAQ
ncbi:MAG: protein kinase [bacterium]|nr:protein kinase [bacterium]